MSSTNQEVEVAEWKPFDPKLVVHLLSYAGSSIRRHRYLAIVLFSVILAGAVASLYVLPKSYHVESKVFAQRNPALAVKQDNQLEGPSRSAEETILQRDNLVSLIHKTDMVHGWYAHRAPLAHLKDVILKAIKRPETEEETTLWMADVLAKELKVWSPSEGVIQISIEWPDPEMALHLVETAVQNYLDARRATEITAIEEQVAILQTHAVSLRKDIDVSVDAIERLRAKRASTPMPSAAPSSAASAAPSTLARTVARSPVAPSLRPYSQAELTRLKSLIEAKQRAISDLEEFRRRRLSELNASLAEKSSTYTDNHPAIIDLRQTIASFSQESPEVQALRADVDRMQKDLDEKVAAGEAAVPASATPGAVSRGAPPLPSSIIRIEQEPSDDRDPEMMYARNQLADAMQKYAVLRTQIETAQIDLDTAQAAFKYRYTVVEPPLYPKGASKPKPAVIIMAGLVGALLVPLLVVVGADLRKGRYLASWQVERTLDLPLLAEMDASALAEHKLTE